MRMRDEFVLAPGNLRRGQERVDCQGVARRVAAGGAAERWHRRNSAVRGEQGAPRAAEARAPDREHAGGEDAREGREAEVKPRVPSSSALWGGIVPLQESKNPEG